MFRFVRNAVAAVAVGVIAAAAAQPAVAVQADAATPKATTQVASAVGATSAASAPMPRECLRADMNDGLVEWNFVTHQYGTNYYTYSVIGSGETGNVNCTEPQGFVTGTIDETTGRCIIYGVAAVVGAAAGGGVVASIAFFAGSCGAEIIYS